MDSHRPLIIAFEGIDAAGKTTQAHIFKKLLNAQGIHCEIIYYFDTRLNALKLIDGFASRKAKRDAKLAGRPRKSGVGMLAGMLTPFLSTYSVFVGKYFSVTMKDLVSAEKVDVIILDRSSITTYAYAYLMLQDDALAEEFLNRKAMRKLLSILPWPDLTIHFKVSPKVAMGRKKAAKKPLQLRENEADLKRFSEIYDRLNPNKSSKGNAIAMVQETTWVTIDAKASINEVTKKIFGELKEYVGKIGGRFSQIHEQLK